jgi:HSP20 family protein
MHETDDRVVLAIPMPGLEPADIVVSIGADTIVVHGELRGPHQAGIPAVMAEWTVGPYHREVELPRAVNGPLTNVTYGNGVLVVTMPRLREAAQSRPAELRLSAIAPARGERVGHVGRTPRPDAGHEHPRKPPGGTARAS